MIDQRDRGLAKFTGIGCFFPPLRITRDESVIYLGSKFRVGSVSELDRCTHAIKEFQRVGMIDQTKEMK